MHFKLFQRFVQDEASDQLFLKNIEISNLITAHDLQRFGYKTFTALLFSVDENAIK